MWDRSRLSGVCLGACSISRGRFSKVAVLSVSSGVHFRSASCCVDRGVRFRVQGPRVFQHVSGLIVWLGPRYEVWGERFLLVRISGLMQRPRVFNRQAGFCSIRSVQMRTMILAMPIVTKTSS